MSANSNPIVFNPSVGTAARVTLAGGDRRLRARRAISRVLIADDNVDAAVGLAEWLEAMGYEVYTAHDGIEALEAARLLRPEAVLLDIAMPLLNGDEVCRRLRTESWTRDVLMVAVTGFSGPEEYRRSLEAGFDFHFVKPVDPREIRALLQPL
jgi:CheY-like chemotaxis protein